VVTGTMHAYRNICFVPKRMPVRAGNLLAIVPQSTARLCNWYI
jgi:hypothetical protein